jgi:hypothetical protein
MGSSVAECWLLQREYRRNEGRVPSVGQKDGSHNSRIIIRRGFAAREVELRRELPIALQLNGYLRSQ